MKIVYRNIDLIKDKEYILERHCRINYECDTPWARKMPYNEYRKNWFAFAGQINGFYEYFSKSIEDSRTVSIIAETDDGDTVGYLWVPFIEDTESGFCYADIQDIYIEEKYRKNGIAMQLLAYAETKARKNGAKVLRSGTGGENYKSIALHEKTGFYQYRYEFEKVL